MCGILSLISPTFIAHPTSLGNCANEWECSDSSVIRSIYYQDLELSVSDKRKLANQDKLKDLNNELIKLGNNIKVDKLKEIEQVKSQIEEIVGKETEEIPEDLGNSIDQFNHLIPQITSRGPDYIKYQQFTHSQLSFQLFSSILSLRQPFTSQPIAKDQYVLQFNGEIYESDCEFTNDTEFLINQIVDHGIKALENMNGEFAFVLLDKEENMVYFGRDKIGKRSLCYNFDTDLIISSVPLPGYVECEGHSLYKFDLDLLSIEKIAYNTGMKSLEMGDIEVDSKIVEIYQRLKQSTFIRQETIFPLNSKEANLAVLFSGGIDCTIIAALLMENFIEMKQLYNIDLLTVGFDNPRTGLDAGNSPDRELSLNSWFHLSKKFPQLDVRLIEINIDYESWLLHKKKVAKLMYPQQTEMDLSIAIAFYFASNKEIPCTKMELIDHEVEWDIFLKDRAQFTKQTEYLLTANVLFSGLGADELFAGYSRHESIFSSLQPGVDPSSQFKELSDLLIYDIEIIHKRNLGRDDRVISSWGKELRYPYLDASFIEYVVNEINPNYKIKLEFFTTKKGKTIAKPIRKWILREVAKHMGLEFVQHEPKRAIQFGSKSAKLEIGQSKAKGTDAL